MAAAAPHLDSLPDSSSLPGPPPRSVSPRAVALGLLLLPLNAFWIVQMEMVHNVTHPTTVALFFHCIAWLTLLTALNAAARRWQPRRAWAQGELLLVYAMLTLGSCAAGSDLGQNLVASLLHPFAQATPSNGYDALFGGLLPRWAMTDPRLAGNGFYAGHDTLYTPAHLRAWLPPALIWTGFFGVLLWTVQCVNALLRRQWSDYERLTYPLTRIPLEITRSEGADSGRGLPLVRQRLFWLGFALAFAIDATNSLNYYFPAVPAVLTPGNGQSALDLKPLLTGRPWNGVDWLPLTFYPFVIGLGLLMPSDFLFSSWFFYLLWKVQLVVTTANAWDTDPKMPYANYQALGAYLLFFVNTLWLSRRYLGQVWRRAWGKASELDDRAEPLSYRAALIGIGAGLMLLSGFGMAVGLPWWVAILFFLMYLALALAITRMRVELGTPVHDLHFTGPDWTLADGIGSGALGAHALAGFSLFYWFNRAYRCHPMPFGAEGFRLAEQSHHRDDLRGWFGALLAAGTVGMLCAFWAIVHCAYAYGYGGKFGWHPGGEAWDRLAGWLQQPTPGRPAVGWAMSGGFLFAAFLQAMRVRFAGWPLHPLAYAVSGSWQMNLLWMPLLIAWAAKTGLLRWGGIRAYQAALPFFYGLILGQFIPGSLLTLWGTATGTPTYKFWD